MKIIKPTDFPIEMNTENINILANMALVLPVLPEWRKISLEILTDEQRILVSNKVSELNDEKRQQRLNSLTVKELEENDQKDSTFRGNLLQQELDSIYLENKRNKEKQNE